MAKKNSPKKYTAIVYTNARTGKRTVEKSDIGEFLANLWKNIFAEYNQQDATFHDIFISVRCSTCFRRFSRPSIGAQNCTESVRYLSEGYCYLLLASICQTDTATCC